MRKAQNTGYHQMSSVSFRRSGNDVPTSCKSKIARADALTTEFTPRSAPPPTPTHPSTTLRTSCSSRVSKASMPRLVPKIDPLQMTLDWPHLAASSLPQQSRIQPLLKTQFLIFLYLCRGWERR